MPAPADVVDHDQVVGDETDPAADRGRDGWGMGALCRAPLIVNVVLLIGVLVGVAALTSSPDSFTTDEGSYEIQLRALDQGSWIWHSGTEQLDPDQTHYPVAYAELNDSGWVPLAKHPAWPWLAFQVSRVVGVDRAYAVLGSAAIVVAAISAWFLAALRDRRLRAGAFWVAGLAPVTVTTMFGWAHGASAAAAGVAVVGGVLLTRGSGRRIDGAVGREAMAWVLLLGGTMAGLLLRTEAVLFAAALALALVVGRRLAGCGWVRSSVPGAVIVLITAVILKAEAIWIRSITGGASSTFTARTGGGVIPSSFLDGRYQAATRSLLDPRGTVLSLAILVVVLVAAFAGARVARGRDTWARPWLVAMASAGLLFFVRAVELVTEPIPGMVIAWPILLIGLAASVPWLWRSLPVETVVSAVFAAAILATQYPDGGAVQWGGRFFAPLTVPLAMLVVVGLDRILEAFGRRPGGEVRLARALIIALVVLPLVLGAWVAGSIRTFVTETYDGVDAQVVGVAVTPDPQLPRIMWRHDIRWLVVEETDGGADLTSMLASLGERAEGPRSVSLVLRRYDLAQARRALAADTEWTEVGRHEINGLTVVNLQR